MWRRALSPIAGFSLLALILWGFTSQPHKLSLFVSDELVADWRQDQIRNPYDAALPWIIIPRVAQNEIVDYIRELPTESNVYYLGGHKSAELPPLTGRLHYPIERRQFIGPQSQDVLVIDPSIISPWQAPSTRRKALASLKAQCQRPVVQNEFYVLCSLRLPTANGTPDFTRHEATLQNGIKLLGYDALKTTFRPGDNLQVSLFWEADRPVAERFKAFVHLVGAQWNPNTNDPLWGQRDQEPGNEAMPTSAWAVGSIIEDAYLFRIASDAPPGTYQIEVGMYLPATGERLLIEGKNSKVDHLVLFEVVVQR